MKRFAGLGSGYLAVDSNSSARADSGVGSGADTGVLDEAFCGTQEPIQGFRNISANRKSFLSFRGMYRLILRIRFMGCEEMPADDLKCFLCERGKKSGKTGEEL